MIKLDDSLLQELGLGVLHPEDKKKMLAHIYETLEMRVGMELAKQMTEAQLSEFEQFIQRNDEAGALQWLETNFPNYRDVVAAEFEKLKLEIKQVAPQIVASQQQAQAQMPQQQQQMPPTVSMQQQPYPQPVAQQPMAPAPAPQYPNYPQQQPSQQPQYPPTPVQPQQYPTPPMPPSPTQPQPPQPNRSDYDLAA